MVTPTATKKTKRFVFNVRHSWPEHGHKPDVGPKCMNGRRLKIKNAMISHWYKIKLCVNDVTCTGMSVHWPRIPPHASVMTLLCYSLISFNWLPGYMTYCSIFFLLRFKTFIAVWLSSFIPHHYLCLDAGFFDTNRFLLGTKTDDIRGLGCWCRILASASSLFSVCDCCDALAMS